jgi:hypothetical protein
VIENLRRLHASLTPDHIEDGRHQIQIFATDNAGQETGSRVGRVLVDRTAPAVKIKRRGRRLTVIVSDTKTASGLRRGSVRVSFGDGRRAGASAPASRRKGKRGSVSVKIRHAYEGAGSFAPRVWARDRAGNATLLKRKVRVG